MAGGVGSRFWPISRVNNPKQFQDVLGIGKSLLQLTVERFTDICPQENIYVVTNDIYGDLVREHLPFIKEDQLLLETCGKNTAPCIAYAASKIAVQNPNANLIVSPSDHIILKGEEFKRKVIQGLSLVENQDLLLTLGIEPNRPDTGYGYIKFDKTEEGEVKKVVEFTEKPNKEKAESFVASGNYVWNAGIFAWSAKSILKAFKAHNKEMFDLFNSDVYFTEDEKPFIEQVYQDCESISIDYAIMEKAKNVAVLLCDIGWSDLGTWKSLYDFKDKNNQGNVLEGNIRTYDTVDCIIKVPKHKLVVAEGLKGYIIAEHDNVLLICRKDQEQKVKTFVEELKSLNLNEYY